MGSWKCEKGRDAPKEGLQYPMEHTYLNPEIQYPYPSTQIQTYSSNIMSSSIHIFSKPFDWIRKKNDSYFFHICRYMSVSSQTRKVLSETVVQNIMHMLNHLQATDTGLL